MIEIALPHGGPDPSIVLVCAVADGLTAIEAGAYSIGRADDYLLTVPDTHEAAVRATITAAPSLMPLPVPDKVSQTQFMRAAVQIKLVTGDEAEAYLATGALPAFVSKPLDALPDDQRADARLKAIGATEFFRSDALFALLTSGDTPAATADQVDDLFRLADSLT